MYYFDDLIDKYDYLVLQLISGLSELFDAHDTEHHFNPVSRLCHIIHELLITREGFSDDLCAQLAEAPLQQIANLVDGLLQHNSLHLAAVICLWHDRIVRLQLIRLLQGVLRQLLDNHDDLLDWLDHNALGVIRENQGGRSQHKAGKDSRGELKDCLISILLLNFESSKRNEMFTTYHPSIETFLGCVCNKLHLCVS